MEVFLKIYDDADEWLLMAWLASGTRLWFLMVVLVTLCMLIGYLSSFYSSFLVGAFATLVVGLLPALNQRIFR